MGSSGFDPIPFRSVLLIEFCKRFRSFFGESRGLSDGCAQPNVIYVDPSQTSLQLRGRFSKQEASGKTACYSESESRHIRCCIVIYSSNR